MKKKMMKIKLKKGTKLHIRYHDKRLQYDNKRKSGSIVFRSSCGMLPMVSTNLMLKSYSMISFPLKSDNHNLLLYTGKSPTMCTLIHIVNLIVIEFEFDLLLQLIYLFLIKCLLFLLRRTFCVFRFFIFIMQH